MKTLCRTVLLYLAFFSIATCSERNGKDTLLSYETVLAQQNKELEVLYDRAAFLNQHWQDIGMDYDKILQMKKKERRQLFQKNLRIWAAFTDIQKIENLISAQEQAIKCTEFCIKKINFHEQLEKFLKEIQKNP